MRIGITGISGSLGSALTDRLVEAGVGPIVGCTRDEFKAEQIAQRYGGIGGNVRAMVVVEGITNTDKLTEIFRGCDVLVHTAALKRISDSVYSTSEMVRTNVDGTLSVLKAATMAGIRNVLVISSDKAVEPTNLYGATKMVGECLAVQENSFSFPRGTHISVARYGNVIGSRGSVVPIWQAAHAKGHTLMLTHARATRFLITMNQAIEFIMACLFSMQGGEIFLPRLPSATMFDVALAICGDPAKITIQGCLRPGGEKLAEALLSQEEPCRTVSRTLHGGFGGPIEAMVVTPSHRSWSAQTYPGDPIARETVYRSDLPSTFTPRLTVEQIRALVEP